MRGRDPGPDHRALPHKPGSAGQVIDDEPRQSDMRGGASRICPRQAFARAALDLWTRISQSRGMPAPAAPSKVADEHA
jgi:hypothetical protein